MTKDTIAILLTVIGVAVAATWTIRDKIDDLRADFTADMRELRADFASDIRELRAELGGDIRELRAAVNANNASIAEIRGSLHSDPQKIAGLDLPLE